MANKKTPVGFKPTDRTPTDRAKDFELMAKAMVAPKPKSNGKMTIPTNFNEWVMAIQQLDTTKKLIKLQSEFNKDLGVVPNDKIMKVLDAFDIKADELEASGK